MTNVSLVRLARNKEDAQKLNKQKKSDEFISTESRTSEETHSRNPVTSRRQSLLRSMEKQIQTCDEMENGATHV